MQFSFRASDRPVSHRTEPSYAEATFLEPPNEGTCHLLSLPLEIRQQIWQHVLRPDCAASKHRSLCEKKHQHPACFLGSTRILYVCSQIYHEALEMLHREEKTLKLGIHTKPLRDPRENGKPGYFSGTKIQTRCYIPRQYEELQVLRFRKLHLHIVCPEPIAFRFWNSYDDHLNDDVKKAYDTPLKKTLDNLKLITQVLAKTRHLKHLRLTFERTTHAWSFESLNDGKGPLMPHPPVLEQLQSLVKVMARTHCEVTAESMEEADSEGVAEEPLAEDIVVFAHRVGVKAQLRITSRPPPIPDPSIEWLNSSWGSFNLETGTEDISREGEAEQEQEKGHENHPSVSSVSATILPTILPADQRLSYTTSLPYQLIPECRTCYALFGSWSDLHSHLRSQPNHRRRFRPKVWNQLNHFARAGPGERRCWTCAREYKSVEDWERHNEEKGHGRKGIVPRWREDNRRWDRMWAGRERRGGGFRGGAGGAT